MHVNIAVLNETQAHERRVALVPDVVPKLIKLGAKLHMQAGRGTPLIWRMSTLKMPLSSTTARHWSARPTGCSQYSRRRWMWSVR